MTSTKNFRYCLPGVLILQALLCSLALGADWPMHRGNEQRTGYYPDETGYPSDGPTWRTRLGGPIVSSPVVVGSVVYIGCRDSCLYAINEYDGSVKWKQNLNDWVDATALVHNDMVIVGSRDGAMYICDRRNGDIVARFNTGLQLSSAALAGNGNLITGMGPPLNGFAEFSFSAAKWDRGEAEWALRFAQMAYSSPSRLGRMAFLGSSDGILHGIDLRQHRSVWTAKTDGGVYLSTPAAGDSTVFFAPGNYDRYVYAIDANDGLVLWRSDGTNVHGVSKRSTESSSSISSSLITELRRLSPRDRQVLMEYLQSRGVSNPFPVASALSKSTAPGTAFYPLGDMKTSSVALGTNEVVVVQKELGFVLGGDYTIDDRQRYNLIVLDRFDGAELWKFTELRQSPRLGYCSSPVVTESSIYVGWGEGMLYGFDRRRGELTWQDTLSGDIISSPAIAGNRLYVATMGGYLYAYDLTETPKPESFNEGTYCYPNPAREGVSKIQMYVPRAASVTVVVYNTAERPVFRLSRQLGVEEKSTYAWHVRDVANGVYFAVITAKYGNGKTDHKTLKIAVLN